MARRQILQWDPDAPGPVLLAVRFGKDLPTGLTITAVDSVDLEQQSDADPETWASRTAEVTFGSAVIATDDENNRADAEVQVTIVAVDFPGTGEPEPAKDYRLNVWVTLSDGNRWPGKPELHILP